MHAVVVDLFCGVGGLSYGFKQEGFIIKAGVDSDVSCRYAFETNLRAPFIGKDIRTLAASLVQRSLAARKATYRVLIGCAPCAPFSLYTSRYRKARRRDRHKKWELLTEFARLTLATKPDVVSMENVPRLQRHPIFKKFVKDLRANHYFVTYRKVRAEQYGVPQWRTRLVLFASRYGAVTILPPTHEKPLTVRDAIGDLPRIKSGTAHARDRLHMCRGLTEQNLKRLKATGKGGSWKDWSADLQLVCHKKAKGRSFRSVYGRMEWSAPSPVITTQCLGIGNGRFGHPEQHRAISIREAALLQTFPRKFRLAEPKKPIAGVKLARQIGNAVPVRLGRIIARTIKRHLEDVDAAVAKGVSRRALQHRVRLAIRRAPKAA